MNQHRITVFLLCICLLIVSSCSNPEVKKTSDKAAEPEPSAFDKQLSLIAKTINTGMPMKVGSTMTIEGVEALPGKTLLYKYTMNNMSPGDLDTLTFKKSLEPMMRSTIKGNSAIKLFADNNVSFIFRYDGKDSAYLFSFYVSPAMYK